MRKKVRRPNKHEVKMRIVTKGGLWRNCEDEVLKAGVIKYGTQNWDRISTLLNRKTAKQCKARWNEWLDPSIKKIEWTRQEDEKLLHLAKLIPTQWRTIAPIVGRTPSQCLDRYEKLLDAACNNNGYDNDDPRRLRPGELEPNPETKPARPDAVDMDDDELEMLSQARARLANTRGKKAKRKAREKQIQQARMLASLQKSRECKAAGIPTSTRKRKRRGVDYNAEIPFQKRPPPGFFDVAKEDEQQEESFQPKFPITIEQIEGRKRVDAEQELRRLDVAKSKISQRRDAPSAILQPNHRPEETVRKRMKLMLPPPQISDQELEEIAKMDYASAGGEEGNFAATQVLLANYASYTQAQGRGRTPLPTPQSNAITIQAETLVRLRDAQTPLLGGGDNSEIHPNKCDMQTPQPKPTPIRDELHINKMHERKLPSNFTDLPQPKNVDYQIVIQPLPQYNEEPEEETEQDSSDTAREIAQEKAALHGEAAREIADSDEQAALLGEAAREIAAEEAAALLGGNSKVLQRELSIPNSCELPIVASSGKGLAGLQNEFENVQKTMDRGAKKAQHLEHKIKVLTEGYQIRAGKLSSQIEEAFKQMKSAAKDLVSFQVLQSQEQVAATNRIISLRKEAKKQQDLQQALQSRYGSLLAEHEKFQSLMNPYTVQA